VHLAGARRGDQRADLSSANRFSHITPHFHVSGILETWKGNFYAKVSPLGEYAIDDVC